ncbi:MAG: DNA polymerase III subunit beta [Mariprofundaceae bacterium]
MHVLLSRQDMLQTVQRCQNIVERRHTIPILSNILLNTVEDALHFTATDLEVGIRTCSPATIKKQGSLTVSARKLFDVIKELDTEADIELEAVDHFLTIKSGRSRFRLATLSADEFPDIQIDKEGISIQLDGADLAAMVVATGFAMSNDETRKYLTGTLFEVDKQGNLCLAATDGHRLALTRSRLGQEIHAGQCIVPRKAVNEIRKLSEEVSGQVTLTIGERQISLQAGEHHLSSKLIDARFPNYMDVIPKNNPHAAVVDRRMLDQVLRRTMVVANEFTHDVRLQLSGSEMQVSAHNTDQEQVDEVVAIDYNGPDIEIGFNAQYIRDILAVIKADSVDLSLKDGLSPVLVRQDQDSAAHYVIMPMRI